MVRTRITGEEILDSTVERVDLKDPIEFQLSHRWVAPIDEETIIEEDTQVAVFGGFEVRGQLNLNGSLVVR